MEIAIIGDGVFGTFLYNNIKTTTNASIFMVAKDDDPDMYAYEDTDAIILAVPFDSFEDVCKTYKGKHLVNVCSIQEPTHEICVKYSDRVTSLHPMFGPRTTSASAKNVLLTASTTNETQLIINLFNKFSNVIYEIDGEILTPEMHDKYMARTHAKVVKLQEQIKEMVKDTSDIPDMFITPSFRKLQELADQFLDMPEGTKSSILANRYI